MRRYLDILTEDLDSEPEALAMLKMQGFDVGEELYHGTEQQFEKFERKFSRTAADIYTSPDEMTASNYGNHVYLVIGRQQPQADLMEDHQLLDKLAETFAEEFKDAVEDSDKELAVVRAEIIEQLITKARTEGNEDYDESDGKSDAEDDPRYVAALFKAAKDFCLELLTSGKVYDWDIRGNFQDEVMSECFDLGYKSVRFYDYSMYGDSESVVFHSGDDLFILRQVK